ncbi:Dephospho-CoA kinase domain-containing protein [Orchesella cincta]|uniref:Dephospho-CoA kinase domain-containing protein n=1 Tax=Orchesella cincta TaxID=48709 RepID=A0A1D2MYR7_ORCCI|nr:Dephospho-CoA kinase domain-containing protein [Orchesella cincta]
MFLVGLTGGISTGKSTVSKLFTALSVPIIDADIIARRVVQPGRRANKRIRKNFGDEVFQADGNLNRELLGKIIFNDANKRRQLNSITHPEIFREMCWEILYYFGKGYKFVIMDSPLLFESGTWVNYLKCTIVVSCEENLQLQRLMQRNQLSETDAVARIKAQMPLSEKISKADYVIENSGTLEDTKRQVTEIYNKLDNSKAYLTVRISAFILFALFTGGVSVMISWFFSP